MPSKECSRCLLNDRIPGVSFTEQGEICSVCRNYDQMYGNWSEKTSELERIFDSARKKQGDYDVLVPLSGGKDSCYVLYLCRKVFNLKCLAVTFDNGFLSDHAKQNIANSCKSLGVDHVYFRISRDHLMRLYRRVFLKTGFFCPVCMRAMGVAIKKFQLAFGIPISISGTSRRTEEHVDHQFFLEGDLNFLENVLSEGEIGETEELLLRPIGLFRSPPGIKLPDYLDWDFRKIYKTITEELGWTSPEKDAEHTDCRVERVVQYIRYTWFPDITPEILRFSKLVTCGQMKREEAKKRVEEVKKTLGRPPELDLFLHSLGITEQEFEDVLATPLRHLKHLKKKTATVRRLKAIKRYILPI